MELKLLFKTSLKAVIFDLDGTLLDSYRKSNFEKVARLRKLTIPDNLKFGDYFGKAVEDMVRIFWPNENAEEFHRLWEEVDTTDPPPLIENAVGVLNFLKNSDARIGILTLRRSNSFFPILKECGILNYFDQDLLQTVDQWSYKKPDPRAFENILRRLVARGIPKEKILYVGDTIDDWVSSEGAGLRFVGVETGPIKRATWQAAGLESKNILTDVGWLPCWILKHF